MSTPPRIAVTEPQIDRVVHRFYTQVRTDPTLGPIFVGHIADWPAHEEKIGRFWRNALLFQRIYEGNPMQVHAAAGDVHALHFPVWLSLFDTVLDEELPQPLAKAWSALAHRIGRGLRYGLPGQDADDLTPCLS
jgi:hemoglobin